MSVSEELDYYSKVYINEESIDQNSNNDWTFILQILNIVFYMISQLYSLTVGIGSQ
jgi:hypothetical protein